MAYFLPWQRGRVHIALKAGQDPPRAAWCWRFGRQNRPAAGWSVFTGAWKIVAAFFQNTSMEQRALTAFTVVECKQEK
ncbi:MAG: hypothetical protein ORN29_10375 [Rhodoferax sp.]|nr:hypothetical protein [Rhodoferax sp.]